RRGARAAAPLDGARPAPGRGRAEARGVEPGARLARRIRAGGGSAADLALGGRNAGRVHDACVAIARRSARLAVSGRAVAFRRAGRPFAEPARAGTHPLAHDDRPLHTLLVMLPDVA